MPRTATTSPQVALRVSACQLDDLRLMLREQMVDDTERLRDIEAGLDPTARETVEARLDLVWQLAEQAGGLY